MMTTERKETLRGRTIYAGRAAGEALVTRMGLSFFGGVDPETGVVVEKGHDLEGQAVGGKVLVFSTGKGSTVGSYTLYRLKFNGHAPAAIVNRECETIVAVGCIIAEIPCVDQIAIDQLHTGMRVRVDGAAATVEILESSHEDLADSAPREVGLG
jgi:predicted aconitase with swiveling domain